MTLNAKFGLFRKRLPADMPPQQLLFGQSCYLAGAQAAFQILAAASDKTREESIIIWHELQQEILGAVAQPAEKNLVITPPEKRVII